MGTRNFPAYVDGVTCTANTTAQLTQIASTDTDIAAPDVTIYNPGPLDIKIKTGKATVSATDASFPIPAGAMMTLRKEAGATHVSGKCAGGAQTFFVWCGEGA